MPGVNKPTVILDFDGVLHSYDSGWKGLAEIPDPPTPGAAAAVAKLRETYNVAVVSSRCRDAEGSRAVCEWLLKWGIFVDEVLAHKPPHVVVVDDRALRFEGDWQAVLDGVAASSVPWNKKGKPVQP